MSSRWLVAATMALGVSLSQCDGGPPKRESAAADEGQLTAGRAACPDLLEGASSELPVGDVAWRSSLVEFARTNLKHPAWGFAHSKRNLLLSMQIARIEKRSVDEDVLFAAAFLHDLGGLDGYKLPGVDHAVRSAELAKEILTTQGFPPEKIAKVQEVILAHTYYNPAAPSSPEAIVFRDADVLDFLGAIGFARIASITGRDTPDLASSLGLSRSLKTELPAKLLTNAARCNGEKRAAYLGEILDTVQAETFGGAHP